MINKTLLNIAFKDMADREQGRGAPCTECGEVENVTVMYEPISLVWVCRKCGTTFKRVGADGK